MWMGVERHCEKMDGRVKSMMQTVERCMVFHMEPDGMTDDWIMEQCWSLRCHYSVKAKRKKPDWMSCLPFQLLLKQPLSLSRRSAEKAVLHFFFLN